MFVDRGLVDDSVSDAAIDRTLARLENAEVAINGRTAKIWVRWQAEDGQDEQPVFAYTGHAPLAKFRLVGDGWKIDANKEIGLHRAADFAEPGLWSYHYPGRAAVVEQFTADIQRGKFANAEEAARAWGEHWEALTAGVKAQVQKKPADPARSCYFTAYKEVQRWTRQYYAGYVAFSGLHLWSRRLVEAEARLHPGPAERAAAAQEHLERMQDAAKCARERVAAGRASVDSYLAADFYVVEAQNLAADALAGPSTHPEAAATLAAAARLIFEGHGRNPAFSASDDWSRRWLDLEMAQYPSKTDRLKAAQAYLQRSMAFEKAAEAGLRSGRIAEKEAAAAVFYRTDAEHLLAELSDDDKAKAKRLAAGAGARLQAAKIASDLYWKDCRNGGKEPPERVYEWSERWRRYAAAVGTRAARLAAAEAHLARMKDLHGPLPALYDQGRIPIADLWATEFFVAEAEIRLAEAKAGK
jgi:hypothetical protein